MAAGVPDLSTVRQLMTALYIYSCIYIHIYRSIYNICIYTHISIYGGGGA